MPMNDMWDKRYADSRFIYGIEPNRFFESELSKLKPGKLLLPGDGEGRNAAYAAKLGWEVDAFDYSEQAVINAREFFEAQGVQVNCYQASAIDHPSVSEQYDAVALLYLHLDSEDRTKLHEFLADSVKPGGFIIMEVFSKKQLGRISGGPQNEDMLYDISEIRKDFEELEIIHLEEQETRLEEGALHQGDAMVIRFVARRKNM